MTTPTPDLSPAALEALADRLVAESWEDECHAHLVGMYAADLNEAIAALRALAAATQWRPMETAPKGVWAELVTDPEWVEPPVILLAFPDGDVVMARWDWYYAEHGSGWDGRNAWVIHPSAERVADYFGHDPTGWRPIPTPLRSERSEGGR